MYSFFHCIIDFRTFAADLSPNNQVFAPGVKFMMGNGESVPYDPLTFYHGVLVGQLTLSCTAIIIVLITSMCIQIKKKNYLHSCNLRVIDCFMRDTPFLV